MTTALVAIPRTTEIVPVLDAAEHADRVRLEDVVQRGLGTFLEVGLALKEINDRNLFRDEHKDFRAYVQTRFGFGKAYAYRMIACAEVVNELKQSPIGDTKILPVNEAQARPLTDRRLDLQQRTRAWEDAVRWANEDGDAITAAIVNKAVQNIVGAPRRHAHQRQGTKATRKYCKTTKAEATAMIRDLGVDMARRVAETIIESTSPLTDHEQAELDRCEDVIRNGGEVTVTFRRKAEAVSDSQGAA